MKRLHIDLLDDMEYVAIITILDYEILLSKCFEDISFEPSQDNFRKVLVDLALKTGINKYRYVEFNVSFSGKIILDSHKYIIPNGYFVDISNAILSKYGEIVLNSILSDTQKNQLLSL